MHAWMFHSGGHVRSDGTERWDCTRCGATVYRIKGRKPSPDKKTFVSGLPGKLWCEEILVFKVLES